jgi:hypothetical protein
VSVTATVTDNDGDQASSSVDLGHVLQINDDGPVISGIDNGIVADAANTSVTGNIIFTSGADGFGTPVASLAGNVGDPAGLTFNGQQVHYTVDSTGEFLTAYIGTDSTIVANDIFTLSVDPNSDQYHFTLLQPFIEISTLAVGSSSAFGSGPAGEQILLTDGSGTAHPGTNEATVVSGIDNDGVTNGAVNGSTVGWGVNNNNFDVGEKMLFDFTAGGSQTPGGVPGFQPLANEEVANYTFSAYKGGDDIHYTITYWDGTHLASKVSFVGDFDPSTHSTVATEFSTNTAAPIPAGDVLYTVDFTDVTGSGKVDLQSVGVLTTQNLSENLSFNVNTTDGDGDTASGTIHINIDGSTTIQGTAANDAIGGSSGNETIIGGAGVDSLTGGGGNDIFQYNNPLEGGGQGSLATITSSNTDTITDFNTANDTIAVSAAGFGGGLTAGEIFNSTQVENSSSNAFTGGATERFLFDTTNHTLYYSPDGTTANEHAVAIINLVAAINPTNIHVVA